MYYIKNFEKQDYTMNDFIKDAERLLRDPYENTTPKYPLTNVGYVDKTLVFELALAGFKKENIKVQYVGNVVTVKATYEKEADIQYIQKNISTKEIERKFYLSSEYLGGEVKWKYSNGLLTITVKPNGETNSIQASEDDSDLFGIQEQQEQDVVEDNVNNP